MCSISRPPFGHTQFVAGGGCETPAGVGALTFRKGSGDPQSPAADAILEVGAGEPLAFDLSSGGHWFGHGFNHIQPCPLETGSLANPLFAVNNIRSPIWMCSSGVAILAETNRVLDVRCNENGDGVLRIMCPAAPLRVRMWQRPTLPLAQAELLRHLGWPNTPPAAELFGDSLFCTWTQYPRMITQARILDMARQIRARGYPCTTLLIDDRWESCFGDLTFSTDFPDPAAMIRELHDLGFRVWLWVTPFVNQEADRFQQLAGDNVLVPRREGPGAALFKWWGGTAGLIDVTAPQGRRWLRECLQKLREQYGVDGFKIDGGDFKYQPSPDIAAWHEFAGESGYPDALLSVFEELVPCLCESRTAWLSQSRSVIWREGGKDSHWGLDNGLKALITLALHLGLMGYDILIPDMVPGRVQTLAADIPLPTDELMVRWTEASAFLPLLQFSYFPWNYAAGTEQVVRGFALLHHRLKDYIAAEAEGRSAPLIRPLWYDSPEIPELYQVSDQFLLGHALMAAPVVEPGALQRDIAIPPGRWLDAWTGREMAPGRYSAFPAPCPGIPLFVRAGHPALAALVMECLRDIPRGGISSGVTTATYQAGLDRDIAVTG